jgi:hypothetical protein
MSVAGGRLLGRRCGYVDARLFITCILAANAYRLLVCLCAGENSNTIICASIERQAGAWGTMWEWLHSQLIKRRVALSADLDLDDCRRRAFRILCINKGQKRLVFIYSPSQKRVTSVRLSDLKRLPKAVARLLPKLFHFKQNCWFWESILNARAKPSRGRVPWPAPAWIPSGKTRKNTKLVSFVDKTFPATYV